MKIRASILLLAIASQSSFAESVYTWKDENGRVHFSDKSQSPKAKEVSSSSKQNASYTSKELIGNWAIEANKNGVTMRTTFTMQANGSFSGGVEANGNPFMTYAGKWELVGDRINWIYTETSIPLPDDAKKDSDKIISVSSSKIDIVSIKSGEKRSFIRQKS